MSQERIFKIILFKNVSKEQEKEAEFFLSIPDFLKKKCRFNEWAQLKR